MAGRSANPGKGTPGRLVLLILVDGRVAEGCELRDGDGRRQLEIRYRRLPEVANLRLELRASRLAQEDLDVAAHQPVRETVPELPDRGVLGALTSPHEPVPQRPRRELRPFEEGSVEILFLTAAQRLAVAQPPDSRRAQVEGRDYAAGAEAERCPVQQAGGAVNSSGDARLPAAHAHLLWGVKPGPRAHRRDHRPGRTAGILIGQAKQDSRRPGRDRST